LNEKIRTTADSRSLPLVPVYPLKLLASEKQTFNKGRGTSFEVARTIYCIALKCKVNLPNGKKWLRYWLS